MTLIQISKRGVCEIICYIFLHGWRLGKIACVFPNQVPFRLVLTFQVGQEPTLVRQLTGVPA
jgi:hypothetical protein